jgi:hypothetical protein
MLDHHQNHSLTFSLSSPCDVSHVSSLLYAQHTLRPALQSPCLLRHRQTCARGSHLRRHRLDWRRFLAQPRGLSSRLCLTAVDCDANEKMSGGVDGLGCRGMMNDRVEVVQSRELAGLDCLEARHSLVGRSEPKRVFGDQVGMVPIGYSEGWASHRSLALARAVACRC